MIETINCDLLAAPADLIFHSANCQTTMGSGVALAIKNRYPEASFVDQNLEMSREEKLGKFSVAKVIIPQGQIKYIVNLYTQLHYGRGSEVGNRRFVNYEAFYSSIEKLYARLIDNKWNYFTVACPYKISSDRAGGSWPVIYAMLDDVFGKSKDIKLLICKL